MLFELDATLGSRLLGYAPDVVFPAVHGTQGEDGCLQGLLEIIDLPYVGSDVRGSALSADKVAAKHFFRSVGLRVAQERVLSQRHRTQDAQALLSSLRGELGQALIVKPAQGGSTLGMSRVREGDGVGLFQQALDEAFAHDAHVLVEQFIEGKEVTCAVFQESGEARAFPVTLIEAHASDWMDFQSKYLQGGAKHTCPAPLDEEVIVRIQQAAVAAHLCLGLRDLSRADFIVPESQEAVILEVNTLPGMTEVSLFPEAAQAAGISFSALLDRLVTMGVSRPRRKAPVAPPLPKKMDQLDRRP
jgi:D-alanine-D-alanine ligase